MPWKFFIRLTTDLLIIWTVFAYTFFITIISNLNCFCPYFLNYNHLACQVSTRSDCSSAEKTKLQQTTWLNFLFYPSMHACFIYCLHYSIKYDYIFFKHYNQSSSFSTLYIIHLCKEKERKKLHYKLQKFCLDRIHTRFSTRLISYEVGLVPVELFEEKLHILGRYHLWRIPPEL